MRDLRSLVAASRTVAVAIALVVGGLPSRARAGEPVTPVDAPPGPVEPSSPPIAVGPADAPPELVAPPVAALGEARRLEAELRFAEAARIYEAQWQATGDARFLYHAGAARSRAGHHAIALRWFSLCLQTLLSELGAVPDAVRRALEGARERELAATRPVTLMIVEGSPTGLVPVPELQLAGARVTAQQLGPTGEPVPWNSLEIEARPSAALHLDPGAWSVQVEIPGFLPATLRQVASDATAPWQIVVQRRKVVVDLRFAPERALRGARMRLDPIDQPSQQPLERPLVAPTATVMLTPGRWRLEVRARRHGADLDLAVGPGQRPIDVALLRRPAVDDPRLASDRKLAFGLFGAFAVTYFTGVGLLLAGANREKRAERRDAQAYADAGVDPEAPGMIDAAARAAIESAYPAARLHRDLEFASDLHTAGVVIAGAGVGAVVSLLPVVFRAPRRAAVVELGLGGALLAGGAGWLAWSLGERGRLLDAPEPRVVPARLDRSDGHRIAASLLTGLGLGLAVFSGVVLARDAADRRRRARAFTTAPWAAPGLAGWSLGGRF